MRNVANGDGGWLLIGVEDSGTVVGARHRHDGHTDERRLAALVSNKTSPAISVDVTVTQIDGKDVIGIRVPSATGGVVSTTSGRYLRRAVDVEGKPQCLPMVPHEVIARTSSVGVRDLSALPMQDLVLDDLDPDELKRFRSLASAGGDPVLAELSDSDLLSALGFRTVDGTLTLGAVLLFGTPSSLRTFVPTHETAFQVLDAQDAVEVNRIEQRPLLRSMIDLADAFKRAGLVERTGRGINRVYRNQLALGRPQPDYSRSTNSWVEARLFPGPADRELAAFVAASARDGKPLDLQTLQVLHEVRTESRISSGRAAELLQVSSHEARMVLNVLVERGLLEARGERKGRTYHLAAAIYREIGESAAYVRARGFDSIQQEQMVLTYIDQHGSIRRAEAAELCQLSPNQASYLLRRMVGEGKLDMVGERRSARYVRPGDEATG